LRSASAAHLVGGQLLTLPAAAEHDPEVGLAVAHRAGGGGAEDRVVDALGRVRPVVDDLVAGIGKAGDQVLLEHVAGMIGPERDACHGRRV
jgi:hypothetical protein